MPHERTGRRWDWSEGIGRTSQGARRQFDISVFILDFVKAKVKKKRVKERVYREKR